MQPSIATMKILHKPSGYLIKTEVSHYHEIRKFNPGIVIINQNGLQTNRIAPDPTMYDDEQSCIDASLKIGKIILLQHLSGEVLLNFM